MFQPQSPSPSLVPPSSREALLEWGRSLVSSNRAHNPAPTLRYQQPQQSQQLQQNNNNNSNNISILNSPNHNNNFEGSNPPNRPSLIGGVSVASQTAQIIANGGVPGVAPRVVSGNPNNNNNNMMLSNGNSTNIPSSTNSSLSQPRYGNNNNNNVGLFSSPSTRTSVGSGPNNINNNAASNNNLLMFQHQSGSAVNLAALANNSNNNNYKVQHEPSGMGELQPPPVSSSSFYNLNNNNNNNNSNSNSQQLGSATANGMNNNNNNNNNRLRGMSNASNQSSLGFGTPSGQQTPNKMGSFAPTTGNNQQKSSFLLQPPQPQQQVGDTPLHRLSMMADNDDNLLSSSGANPMNSGDTSDPNNNNNNNNNNASKVNRLQSSSNLLASNAQTRKAVLEDHRTYISHLKSMLESNDDRFRNRERELTQILERLVDAEKGIAESISTRTNAAALGEAAQMRLLDGEPRIFDGTDTAALEQDIEEARDEIVKWENEEALCGAAVAQLAASIAELELQASDSVRIYMDSLRHVLKLGEITAEEARHGVSAHTNSTLIGEVTASNKNRLYNAVAGNLDRAHLVSQRIKVGLASIEKLCAAARAHSAGNKDEYDAYTTAATTTSADTATAAANEKKTSTTPSSALLKIANVNNRSYNQSDPEANSTIRVAGIEIFTSLSGPSVAVNDYVVQLNEALTAAHQMRELIVNDLHEASHFCNEELRKTGAVVDDAHQALQELVAQVDAARDQFAESINQEEAIIGERADVARQLRALETAADDHKKKIIAEQDANAQARKKVEQLQGKLRDVETRTTGLKAKELELEDERTHSEEKLKLAQAEELAANDVVAQLAQQLTLAKGAHDAAKRRADKAQDQRGDYQSELTSLEEEQATLEAQIKQHRLSIRTVRQQFTEKQKSNSDRERNVQQQSIEYESSLSSANAAERESSMAIERLDKTKEELRLLTAEENDLRAQINAINEALLVENGRQQAAKNNNNNNNSVDQFTLSGRGAIGSRSQSAQQLNNLSRKGSVVNIVDIPVTNNNNNNGGRRGSAAISSSSHEPLSSKQHVPMIHVDPSSVSGSSHHSLTPRSVNNSKSFPVHLANQKRNNNNNNNNSDDDDDEDEEGNDNNMMMSDGTQGFKMLTSSPERVPVLVSMDTRHYTKTHFPGQSERSRSSVSPTSHNNNRTGSHISNTTPISSLQHVMMQQRHDKQFSQHALTSAMQQQQLLQSRNNQSPSKERSTSRLSKFEAEEALYQNSHNLQNRQFLHQQQPTKNSISPPHQHPQNRNNTNTNSAALQQLQQQTHLQPSGGMSSVQSRLDSILQRKQNRERFQQPSSSTNDNQEPQQRFYNAL